MEEKNKPSTPSQTQMFAFKEYTEITKRVMKYDDDDCVKNNQNRVSELVHKILDKYDSISWSHQEVENKLIETKLMHAEAVEAKERLQIELDAAYEYNKKMTVKSKKSDSNNNSFEKVSIYHLCFGACL